MWLENLRELKERTGMSSKQIADMQNVSEKSVKRVFTGEAKNPGVELIRKIIEALGGSWYKIFADSGAVIGSQDLATLQAEVNRLTEENNILAQNLNMANIDLAVQKDKLSVLTAENELLNTKLAHKDEIIALHNNYCALIGGLAKGHSKKHGHE
jgi:transcriptional regulator with XRE-family HTH domain